MDLAGRLGLKEWLAEALSPIEKDGDAEELLYANFHPKPNQAAAPAPKPGTTFQPITPKVPGIPPAGFLPLHCNPEETTEIKNNAEAIKTTINSMQASKVSMAAKAKTSAESMKSKFDKLYKSVSASDMNLGEF
jgi:hypothetical protein